MIELKSGKIHNNYRVADGCFYLLSNKNYLCQSLYIKIEAKSVFNEEKIIL
jgi:hypothetical protein